MDEKNPKHATIKFRIATPLKDYSLQCDGIQPGDVRMGRPV